MSEYRPMKKENAALTISLFEILAVLYIAHNLLPIVGYYMPSVAYLGVFGLTFMLVLPVLQYKRAWSILGIFAVSLLALFTNSKSFMGGVLNLYGVMQHYLYGIIALQLILTRDKKICRRVLVVTLVMYIVTAVTTIIGNEKYPQASRMIATLSNRDFLYTIYVKENIGGFTFVYELVLLIPLLIYLIRSKTIRPVLGYVILVLVAITVFVTEYGMAIMLLAASLPLLLLPKLTTKRLVILLMIILVLFVFFAGFIADVFENISEQMDSDTLSDRFLAVAQALRGEDQLTEGGTGANRMERYQKSMDAFRNTSFLGGWGKVTTGGHSFVFDALGNFGLVGIAALVIVFYSMYMIALNPCRGQAHYPYFLWTYMIAVVLMVMNPKNFGVIFLYILPVLNHVLMEKPN